MLAPMMVLVVMLSSLLLSPALPGTHRLRTSPVPECVAQDGKMGDLRQLRRERRQKEAQVEALKKGKDAKTEESRKKIQALEAEIAEKGKTIQDLVPKVVQELIKGLKADAQETRDRAVAGLAEVGSAAIPDVEALAKSGTPDDQARAQSAIKLIRSLGVDDTGVCKQWAADAEASSEYGEDQWSAQQACGEPDTDEDGDVPTAWASQDPDGGEEWLELTYKHAVRPVRVRVHETFNPGAVVKIEARDAEKKWHVLWKGKDPTEDSPAYLDVSFDPPNFVTRVIRVTLDTEEVEGWNEIDAVQLLGEPAGESVAAGKK
ncbi:MAG: hypothetical protein HY716_17740 [Planctomycetes bacterium]|nr:hypothetical protein [Planctomycetota bacterium]